MLNQGMLGIQHAADAARSEQVLLARDQVPVEQTWDLSTIFADDNAWETAFQRLQDEFPEAGRYAGRLGESPKTLLKALRHAEKLRRKAYHLGVYAHLRKDQDTADSHYSGMESRSQQLFARLAGELAYMKSEMAAIPTETYISFLDNEDELVIYRHYFAEIERRKAHTLSEEEEILLAKAGEVFDAGQRAFSSLSDADLVFPDIVDDKGQTVHLTQSRYISLLENRDRRVRKDAYTTYYRVLGQFANTFASVLQSQIKQDNFLAQTYLFDNACEAALFDNAIPVKVFRQLIDTVERNLHLLHRYTDLRKRVLNLSELHGYDLYVPMVEEADYKISIDEAQKITLAALKPLGDEYAGIIRKAFDERWIDWPDNRGKRSGAYSSGTYGTNPFILMNWRGTLDNLFTLVHELGHSAHSYLTRQTQPFVYGDYSIFLAEIASTTNENLLTHHLLQNESDPALRRSIINHYLDGFKGTVFRQTQFASFEDLIHRSDQEGTPLTADFLKEQYAEINARYYGSALERDEELSFEWCRIPHFFYNYYVYQYATGFSAATAFAKRILEEGQPAVEQYLNFLRSGSSAYPIDVLARAGLDMTSPEPIEEALQSFEQYLDLFEA